ncbi:hypothetical protein [Lysinibacter sp. HNR]|uniref:hypothetical protein n=1 Tax=Lysinibacter sp. HNR TaxID=3031408 RepID=UPI002435BFFC|nr:hypothetical protein [Lysinibacter sp. HNR]WGD37220.1 hypothetical protein FrondiHNR_12425 [Lysinibacter sp. HNR]
MSDLTANQLAERLGITKRHALNLLSTQAIAGRRLANGIWLANSDAIARYEVNATRGSGRTLDTATAWGLLWELSGLEADWLSPSTRARVFRRIREADISMIASVVSKRTRAHRYTAANTERAAANLIATGRTAAHLINSNLIEDRRHVCGYVRSGTVENYARSHFMVAKENGSDVLYDNTLPINYDASAMPPAVIAADLARSTDTRERSAGLQSLERLRQQWLAVR